MIINFVGSFTIGERGEVADEIHLALEMESLGHTVRKIPRDAWREYVIEKFPKNKYDVPEDLKADINIICKWHHFYDGSFVQALRNLSNAPVFYWVWDYMQGEDWHMAMAKEADLYLGNDVFSGQYKDFENAYYFPFDCADEGIDRVGEGRGEVYDVSFFGSYLPQGERIPWLSIINSQHKIKIFSVDHGNWKDAGFDAEPAVWGEEFAQKVANSKICLGFNVNDHCWGYWSNRVGKTLCVGGLLLQRYVPGMELFVRGGAEYFSSPQEAVSKIKVFLADKELRNLIRQEGYRIGRDRFTSRARVEELHDLIGRRLSGGI